MLVLPAAGREGRGSRFEHNELSHLSSAAALHIAAADPERAAGALRGAGERLQELQAEARAQRRLRHGSGGHATSDLFNADAVGLPQNEEAVNACRANTRTVLGGTNDYRGLLDPNGDFTGWHFSNDGGRSLTNEGLLPPVPVGGVPRPSGGDPVVAIDDQSCALYMVDLNFDPNAPDANSNGIGVYRSDAATLASCPGGGADESCWRTRRAAAEGAPPHFLDKPWADVGRSGAAGKVVWVTYTDFTTTGPGETDFTASIYAVRCDAQLAGCTRPILISGGDQDVQFSYVTIGQGRPDVPHVERGPG